MAPGRSRRFASGAALSLFERLDSTSLEAKRRAESGARGPLWIVALEQTAGYGRRGSAWMQAAGDFAGTLLFEPKTPRDRLSQLSFVAALAVADVVKAAAPGADIRLKWPNDILADGGKIAGLLLELLEAPAGGGPLLALGVGVNIVSKPSVADYPTARLIDFCEQTAPSPALFAEKLDDAFSFWQQRWRTGGFAEIREAWLKTSYRLGATIRVRALHETLEGVFTDLDSGGALVLDCADGRRVITAGAVAP